ncbi:MAG: hypothetical protein RBT02_09445 [Bacteroidales bacterium]|jgi:hypothetical protein|nr:hypothetical protein [Bacteroidales bacterium]
MKSLLWTGKLTLPVRLLINANNILAWLNGNWGDKAALHGYDSDRIQFCQLDAESLPSMI